MQEMTMIERVARALARDGCEPAVMSEISIGLYVDKRWDEFEGRARAAIEAMRYPTPLMQRKMSEAGIHPNVHRSLMGSLIDAALEE